VQVCEREVEGRACGGVGGAERVAGTGAERVWTLERCRWEEEMAVDVYREQERMSQALKQLLMM